MLPGFGGDGFHAEGIELAIRLKTMIGDRCEVLYEKPYEDPGKSVEPIQAGRLKRKTKRGAGADLRAGEAQRLSHDGLATVRHPRLRESPLPPLRAFAKSRAGLSEVSTKAL